ncbi:WD40 repeat-like protein [Coemansia reversa NRRL 1564]|uniref:WD40 repeat-like protein n=1 Tax=Coemansia reversa (strain ATCC 12441 / NRRL 1564) TaxID=763665 RepID=A0A2G5B7D9_COERN|nr:WD40 repeat-like protein [Coemansia reversa NRRL 1564]|eukprot:PIA14928.1 WD40 repeat-like protein [Coemansia reversa NRRL 1564]
MALNEITLRANNNNFPSNRGVSHTRQTTLFDALGTSQRRNKRLRRPQCLENGQENTPPEDGYEADTPAMAEKRIRIDAPICTPPIYNPSSRTAWSAGAIGGSRGLYSPYAALRTRQHHAISPGCISTIGRFAAMVSPAAAVFRLCTDADSQLNTLPLACKYSSVSGAQGSRLALADEGGHVSIFDTLNIDTAESAADAGLQPIARWRAHDNAVFDVEWSADNTQAVTASADESCCLWDVESQQQLGSFIGHSQTVRAVSWRHEDHHCFATASRDGAVMMWDVRCNKTRREDGYAHRPVNIISSAHYGVWNSKMSVRGKKHITGGSVTAIQHLRHNTHLIASAGSTSEVVKYWDVRMKAAPRASALPTPVASSLLLSSTRRSRGTSSLVLDPDGTRLYTACNDNRLYVHNALAPGLPIAQLSAPEFECQSFNIGSAASPCGRHIAAGSSNGSVVVWELDRFGYSSSGRRAVLQGHTKEAGCIAWYPGKDRTQLATCGDDGILRIWEEDQMLADSARTDPAKRFFWGTSQVHSPTQPAL